MKRKEPQISGTGVFIVSLGAVVGVGLWIAGIFMLPNATTHEDMKKLPAVGMYQGNQSSSSSGTSSGASGSSSSTGSQSASGLPFPTQHPTDTKIMDVSATGYTIFENTCSGCHGQNLQGSVGPSLLGIGNVASASQLQSFITQGKGLMPPNGGLTDPNQVQQVAAWLAKQTQK